VLKRLTLLLLLAPLAACPPPHRIRPLSKATLAQIGLPGEEAPPANLERVFAIDVGQGSATLFEFPCAAVLVDTGGEDDGAFHSTEHLIDFLDRFFERRPDLNRTLATVFLTHPHIDHTRGIAEVMSRYHVLHLVTDGRLRDANGDYESGGEDQEKAEALARSKGALRTVTRAELKPGGITDDAIDAVSCGEVDPKISVLWGGLTENSEGWEPRTFNNANNHSLTIRVDVKGHAVLVVGDLEDAALDSMVNFNDGTPAVDVDVYVVAHHGSDNGTTFKAMQAMTPCIALMSMGPSDRHEDWSAWQYGHPRKLAVRTIVGGLTCNRPPRDVQVATRMKTFEGFTVTKALYGTGWEGTLMAELQDDGTWKVRTEK